MGGPITTHDLSISTELDSFPLKYLRWFILDDVLFQREFQWLKVYHGGHQTLHTKKHVDKFYFDFDKDLSFSGDNFFV